MGSTIWMFIPFLKQLITDFDPGEIKRVEDILIANQIPYRIKSDSPRDLLAEIMIPEPTRRLLCHFISTPNARLFRILCM
jgi:hypothetical protein